MLAGRLQLSRVNERHIVDVNDFIPGEMYHVYRTTGSSNGPLHVGHFTVLSGEVFDDPRLLSGKAILVLDRGKEIHKDLWHLGLAPSSDIGLWNQEQFVSTEAPSWW